ncbi:MAG: hypothetical protein M3N41_10105 [Acidobacteriota bacterium]|nr:hypothetical protein [Acidobacteriota bacterium]
MPSGIVVLFGGLPVERKAFDPLVSQFGWSVKEIRTVRDLAKASLDYNLIAVLFDPQYLSLRWDKVLRCILNTAPRTLPILCHRFAETIDWPKAAEAGVFHSLHWPLNQGEVRQSLGFVWGATRHSAAISMQIRPDPKGATSEQTQESGASAVAMVA